MKTFTKDNLQVKIADSRGEMGAVAGREIAERIRQLQEVNEELNIIFAAAPSQNETLSTLLASDGIQWNRINAFHMDEYVGLPQDDPRCFGNFLKNAIFKHKPFKNVYYINGNAENLEMECHRYAQLLAAHPVHLVCLGIGENGHIAFNDPPVADFQDPVAIKKVQLDEICRQQQVNDGCFATLDEVPKYALTLTVPTLFRANYLFCSVPASTKASAVRAMLNDPISEACPATVLRRHSNAFLYCDNDSSALL